MLLSGGNQSWNCENQGCWQEVFANTQVETSADMQCSQAPASLRVHVGHGGVEAQLRLQVLADVLWAKLRSGVWMHPSMMA